MTLIAEFKALPEFRRLSPSSVRSYLFYIKLIEDEFGDLPLAALADRRVRGEFKNWRDRFANTPRKADYAWSILARILAFSKDRGLIASNPCERGGRLYSPDRTDKVWRDEDVAAFLAIANSELALAMILALWTGQRQGDLLRLSWSAYDGAHIRLRQSKTGAVVMAFGPAELDGDIPAINVTSLFQTRAKAGDVICKRLRRCSVKKPDQGHCRLLSARLQTTERFARGSVICFRPMPSR
jgi:integrase